VTQNKAIAFDSLHFFLKF